jgi:hypothetical protein
MKHRQSDRNTQASSLSSKEFSIQASGKMFHMVISGLYSNKPKSITREIYSNAFDAHAMVGKQSVPFDVVYPTPLSPVFKVRDYGPGIAHEDMEDFYTVLGHSTKEDTNDAVGKWGVGRMSPMSYTDSFSVVSRHKGKEAHYSVQLGKDGEPVLHTLAPPHDTTEPDGLEVSFPIDRGDIRDFAQAARTMALGLDVKPNVLNDENPFDDIEVTLQGDNFYFFKGNIEGHGPYAQMGCVLYPINHMHVPSRYYSTNLVIKFGIGDLDVTASREELSYDTETVKNIEDAFAGLDKKVQEIAQDSVESARSLFEAHKIVGDLIRVSRMRGASFDYKGHTINDSYWPMNLNCIIKSRVDSSGKSSKVYWTTESRGFIDAGRLMRIYVQDIGKKVRDVRAAERVFNHLMQNRLSDSECLWIRYDSTDQDHKDDLDWLLKQVQGIVEVVYVKNIPDPGNTSVRSKTKVKKMLGHYSWDDYELSNKEFSDGGLYIPISNNQPTEGFERYKIMLDCLKILGYNSEVIVVPKTYWSKFDNATQWRTIREVLWDYVSKDKDKKKQFALDDWSDQGQLYWLSRLNVTNNKFNYLKHKVKANGQKMDGFTKENMFRLLEVFGFIDPLKEHRYSVTFVKELYKEYPLLHYLGRDREMYTEFAEYVRMVDARNSTHLAA